MKPNVKPTESVLQDVSQNCQSNVSVNSTNVGSNPVNVQYNYSRVNPENLPPINVYPIINVPAGNSTQLIIVNINIVMNK